MDEQAKAMNDLFVSQFEEQHGFIVYQRIPFMSPALSKGTAYIVSAAERERFTADFLRDSPPIWRRMKIDIFLAFLSFIATSEIFHAVFGEYAANVELTLLLVHLVGIVTIESRRLGAIWDAPLLATAGRAPAPFAIERRYSLYKRLAKMRNRELLVGTGVALICAITALRALIDPSQASASPLSFYGNLALCAAFFFIGSCCAAECMVRLAAWLKG
jgi:hypothetical protein